MLTSTLVSRVHWVCVCARCLCARALSCVHAFVRSCARADKCVACARERVSARVCCLVGKDEDTKSCVFLGHQRPLYKLELCGVGCACLCAWIRGYAHVAMSACDKLFT